MAGVLPWVSKIYCNTIGKLLIVLPTLPTPPLSNIVNGVKGKLFPDWIIYAPELFWKVIDWSQVNITGFPELSIKLESSTSKSIELGNSQGIQPGVVSKLSIVTSSVGVHEPNNTYCCVIV